MNQQNETESIYKKIEALEKKIKRKTLQIIHFEAAREAFEKRAAKEPAGKPDIDWLIKGMDYVNFHAKRALKAKYRLNRYNRSLAALKAEIDRPGGDA
jgi:hypothetical protein